VGRLAVVARWFQSGYLYHYALAMILGILVLMSYFVTWPMLAEWLGR
jgi:NADH-quinone oxidoreductase subunit L